MKFYEILQAGFHTPLDAVQIAGLFDVGSLGRQTRCKSVERTEWQTIDELFPHLKYNTSRPFLRRRTPFRLSLSGAVALVPLGALATAVAGYLLFGVQPSVASPIVTNPGSPTAFSSSVPSKQRAKNTGGQRRSSPAGTQPVPGSKPR